MAMKSMRARKSHVVGLLGSCFGNQRASRTSIIGLVFSLGFLYRVRMHDRGCTVLVSDLCVGRGCRSFGRSVVRVLEGCKYRSVSCHIDWALFPLHLVMVCTEKKENRTLGVVVLYLLD